MQISQRIIVSITINKQDYCACTCTMQAKAEDSYGLTNRNRKDILNQMNAIAVNRGRTGERTSIPHRGFKRSGSEESNKQGAWEKNMITYKYTTIN